MSAGAFNITLEQGALFEMLVTVKDSATPPVAIDLTGYVFTGQIRFGVSDEAPIASFSFEIKNQATNRGEVRVYIPSSVSRLIELPYAPVGTRPTTKALYDVEYGPASGERFRLLQGEVTISPEVTR